MRLERHLVFNRTVAAFSVVAMLSVTGPLGAGSPAIKSPLPDPVNQYHPMYFGTFNTGVKTSDVYTEGNISFVVPIWSSIGLDGTLGGGTVFLSPYVSLGEQGELATSLGLGWRYLFNEQSVSALKSDQRAGFLTEGFYIGANVFVDNLRTQFDNDFWQLGIGAEIGSRYLELRGNYYLPLSGGQKLAERTTSTEKFTSQSRRSNTGMQNSATPLGDPFATGHTIQQDAYLTSTAVTTTRTTTTKTTVKTITSLFEEGMEGWDIEAAMLIPGLDQYLDVSLLAGYYSFDNQPFGPQRGGSGNTEGWKLGVEVRPLPALVLSATWYEDEGLTGSDWVAGVGLQIPLGSEWKDAFKPRRRHLAERLAEPVARQNAAIKTSRSVEVDQEVSQTSSTTTAVARRVVSEGPGRIVIKEDVVFVNNGGDVGNGIQQGSYVTGDGTAEKPYETIQSGADHAGINNIATQRLWNVYTQGAGLHGGGAYAESVTLSSSVALTSSFIPIISPIGGIFGTGDMPEVVGGFAGDATSFLAGATVPTAVKIEGYEITGGYDSAASVSSNVAGYINADQDGIHLSNISQVKIADNVITGMTGDGMFSEGTLPGSYAISVTQNLVTGSGASGVLLEFSGGDVAGTIAGNTVNNSQSSGIDIDVRNGSFSGNITGNESNENRGDGVVYYQDNAGDFAGMIANNTSNDNDRFGLNIELDAGDFTGVIAGNTANGNGIDGIYAEIDAGDFTGQVFTNTAYNNESDGINIYVSDLFAGNITGNTANNNEDNGIYLDVNGTGQSSGNVSNNTTNENGLDGISLDIEGSFMGDVSGNTSEGNDNEGVHLMVSGAITGNIVGNIVDSNGGVGIQVEANQFTGTMAFNEVKNSGSTVGLIVDLMGSYAGDFVSNAGLNNYAGSFLLILGPGGDFVGDLSYNIASGDNVGTSLSLSARNLYGNVVGNMMSDNPASGIGLALTERFHGNLSDNMVIGDAGSAYLGITVAAKDFKGNVTNNVVTDKSFGGLNITISDGGGFEGNFEGDVIGNRSDNNSFSSGIEIEVDGTFNGDVESNIANGNRMDGIRVLAGGGIEGNFAMNETLDNVDGVGLLIDVGGTGITGDITQNTANGNGIFGIVVNTNAPGLFVGDFSGNTANNNNTSFTLGGGGFSVTANGGWTGDILNNISNNNTGIGFRINATNSYTGTASGNTSNLNDVGFSTGAILGLGTGTVTGPNTATGNTVVDFETPVGSAIITPLP